ncbi:MAG: hypothetical protein N3A54_01290 [Patescibacteria group bacterium]|nr:hypothetical protein [Patescibacteria group bacterium]
MKITRHHFMHYYPKYIHIFDENSMSPIYSLNDGFRSQKFFYDMSFTDRVAVFEKFDGEMTIALPLVIEYDVMDVSINGYYTGRQVLDEHDYFTTISNILSFCKENKVEKVFISYQMPVGLGSVPFEIKNLDKNMKEKIEKDFNMLFSTFSSGGQYFWFTRFLNAFQNGKAIPLAVLPRGERASDIPIKFISCDLFSEYLEKERGPIISTFEYIHLGGYHGLVSQDSDHQAWDIWIFNSSSHGSVETFLSNMFKMDYFIEFLKKMYGPSVVPFNLREPYTIHFINDFVPLCLGEKRSEEDF